MNRAFFSNKSTLDHNEANTYQINCKKRSAKMKKSIHILLIVISLSLVTFNVSAQCKGFAKKICKSELQPYIHDGNYHAAILSEGEEAELYKTFYANQQYRIAVCGSDSAALIEFKIVDANRNVLYSNREHNLAKTWDFKLEASQQLKIVVKVPVSSRKKGDAEIMSECVAIMFGFKE
jgi:hypothetical protein